MSDEVQNYILALPDAKMADKILRNIRLLNEFGLKLPVDYIHRIWESREKLWELRTDFGQNRERTLFFIIDKGAFFLATQFRKNAKKVPSFEIRQAEKVFYEYLEKQKKKDKGQDN